jgi:multidrug resistance efflux pump
VGLPRTAHNQARVSPQDYLMSIDIEKQRARWRRAQAAYRQAEKYRIVRARYKATPEWKIVEYLYAISPERRLANLLRNQERRSAQI